MQFRMASGLGRMALLGAFASVVPLAPTPVRATTPGSPTELVLVHKLL
jgi:hypothetical protein